MIVIVSGLPRSGTSLMMQMLHAGGMPLLIDDHRLADLDNPKGYWEYAPVRRLHENNSWMPQAEGKALKVVSPLLQYLPPQHCYKIVFMQRPLQEVLASQRVMLQRHGKEDGATDDSTLGALFEQHLERTEHWLAAQEHITVLPVHYHTVVTEPTALANRVATFIGLPLVVRAMAQVVDPGLHRQHLEAVRQEGNVLHAWTSLARQQASESRLSLSKNT
ncbi:MAG: sulfotransferase domain-containing protein [Candidatus Tectimicrobiota bacterium]